jgi:hypothetical protein
VAECTRRRGAAARRRPRSRETYAATAERSPFAESQRGLRARETRDVRPRRPSRNSQVPSTSPESSYAIDARLAPSPRRVSLAENAQQLISSTSRPRSSRRSPPRRPIRPARRGVRIIPLQRDSDSASLNPTCRKCQDPLGRLAANGDKSNGYALLLLVEGISSTHNLPLEYRLIHRREFGPETSTCLEFLVCSQAKSKKQCVAELLIELRFLCRRPSTHRRKRIEPYSTCIYRVLQVHPDTAYISKKGMRVTVQESICRGASSPLLNYDLDAVDAKPARWCGGAVVFSRHLASTATSLQSSKKKWLRGSLPSTPDSLIDSWTEVLRELLVSYW